MLFTKFTPFTKRENSRQKFSIPNINTCFRAIIILFGTAELAVILYKLTASYKEQKQQLNNISLNIIDSANQPYEVLKTELKHLEESFLWICIYYTTAHNVIISTFYQMVLQLSWILTPRNNVTRHVFRVGEFVLIALTWLCVLLEVALCAVLNQLKVTDAKYFVVIFIFCSLLIRVYLNKALDDRRMSQAKKDAIDVSTSC